MEKITPRLSLLYKIPIMGERISKLEAKQSEALAAVVEEMRQLRASIETWNIEWAKDSHEIIESFPLDSNSEIDAVLGNPVLR